MTTPSPATIERAPRPTDIEDGTWAQHLTLMVSDKELLQRLGIDFAKGRLILRALDDQHQKTGFPQPSKLWGKRYWPAVKAWLDKTNGLNMERQGGFRDERRSA